MNRLTHHTSSRTADKVGEVEDIHQEWRRPPEVPLVLDQFTKPIEKRILDFTRRVIRRGFGLETYVLPPKSLRRQPRDLWEPLSSAGKLKQLKVIDSLIKIPVVNDLPRMHIYFTRVHGARRSHQNAIGSSLSSEPRALWATIGEAVDRYSLIHFKPASFLDAPYRSITTDALNIFSIAGLSFEDRTAGELRSRLAFDAATKFRWVRGYSLTHQRLLWVPLQLVTFYHRPESEPILRLPISTGSAAGQTLNDAIYRGLLEIIERDAFMITWLKKISPATIDLESFSGERIGYIKDLLHRYQLELHILHLPTDVPCHVILAVIIDRTPGHIFLSLGMRADLNIEEAIINAIEEALLLRITTREDAPKPLTELPDLSEVNRIDRDERYHIWAARRDLEPEIRFLFSGRPISLQDAANSYAGINPRVANVSSRIKHLITFFRNNGYEVAYVDNLPLELNNKISLRSVYVVVPEFQPMHLLERLPYFSGRRLDELPKKLGLTMSPGVNTLPHPFP